LCSAPVPTTADVGATGDSPEQAETAVAATTARANLEVVTNTDIADLLVMEPTRSLVRVVS
jgi:hypothetical protein